jgi:UDP-3-O-[3-hydroxymyristoyl] glucosamine N-acyltransferase
MGSENCVAAQSRIGSENYIAAQSRIGSDNCVTADFCIGSENCIYHHLSLSKYIYIFLWVFTDRDPTV